jgi:hypothetical protein
LEFHMMSLMSSGILDLPYRRRPRHGNCFRRGEIEGSRERRRL